MKLLKGLLAWPLLWLFRKLHLGDGEMRRRRQATQLLTIMHQAWLNEQMTAEKQRREMTQ